MPKFDHQFDPPSGSALGREVDLSTREVEDAGLFEVLQTPGAALGTWSLFNALIDTTTPDFRFHEPLGKSREVKTALSGLFGRFVARAYANKHLGYTFFASIHGKSMPLAHGRGMVKQIAGGDRPDWAVWGPAAGLGILEAKGSHDWAGPSASLARAYTQTHRVEIQTAGQKASFKRYAISTRWGFMQNGPARPMLWVKDPDEPGDGLPPDELQRLGLGIARRHYASLLQRLGHVDLSKFLLAMAEAATESEFVQAQQSARAILSNSDMRELTSSRGPEPQSALIGGFITRAGPLNSKDLSVTERETLQKFGLGPTFVGAERDVLNDVIEGNAKVLKEAQVARRLVRPSEGERVPRDDGTGTWVFRLVEDEGVLS